MSNAVNLYGIELKGYPRRLPDVSYGINIDQISNDIEFRNFFSTNARAGDLEKNGHKLLFDIEGGVYVLPVINYFSATKNSTELIAEMAEVPEKIMSRGQPSRLRLRRDKSIVVFEYSSLKNATPEVFGYGYCHGYHGTSHDLDTDIYYENKAFKNQLYK
ncbi:MAG: hypothetical protein AABY64_02430 [Bdellovibrionota bacterium]